MHNKIDFLRLDWKTYIPKYKLFCREKEITQQITLEKLAQVDRKDYIRRINIKEK